MDQTPNIPSMIVGFVLGAVLISVVAFSFIDAYSADLKRAVAGWEEAIGIADQAIQERENALTAMNKLSADLNACLAGPFQ